MEVIADEYIVNESNKFDVVSYFEKLGYSYNSDDNIKSYYTPNGTGYVITSKDGNGSIILPPDYQNADTLAFLVCGHGGTGNSLYGTGSNGPQLITNAKDGVFPPYPVVLASNSLYQSEKSVDNDGVRFLEDTYNVLTESGAEIKNLGGMMFSEAGRGGLSAMNKFLSKHQDKSFNTRIVLNDAYTVEDRFNYNGYNWDKATFKQDGDLSFLKDAEIVSIYRTDNYSSEYNVVSHNGYSDTQLKIAVKLATLGFNIVTIASGIQSHLGSVNSFFNDFDGWNYFSNGSFQLFDENGNQIYGDPLYLYIRDELVQDNVDLNNISLLSYDDTSLSSNSKYVIDVMNTIRSKISSSKFLDSENIRKNPALTTASASSLLGKINGCIDSYNNMVEDLHKNLIKETDAIASYAIAIDEMDNELAAKGIKL